MKKEIYEELTRIGERRLAKMGANFSDYLQVEPGEILLSKKRILPPQCIRGVSELGIAYHLFELPNRNNIERLIKKQKKLITAVYITLLYQRQLLAHWQIYCLCRKKIYRKMRQRLCI